VCIYGVFVSGLVTLWFDVFCYDIYQSNAITGRKDYIRWEEGSCGMIGKLGVDDDGESG